MIQKLLIANRGEIAVRIIHAARELGIRTVAITSEADQSALHASLADEVVNLEGNAPEQTYLNIPKILRVAHETSADAIHPGYGFLSERAVFAKACIESGFIFVGPPPEAMEMLGAKIESKKRATGLGIPVVPGFYEENVSSEKLFEESKKIGFPVMLKASAGGGGRGMRIVPSEEEFTYLLRHASEEAQKSFGDGTMMVEKLIQKPRHIEVQVIADAKGNVWSLFERECSLQRRHQKIIEESPAPYFIHTEKKPISSLWPAMQNAAIELVKSVGYQNAGTVEFIIDETTDQFFFLEVNTRLQVEHPVTEFITGVDLVQMQLLIASGLSLEEIPFQVPKNKEEIHTHAIEARIVAEDPANEFLPSSGKIAGWLLPSLPGVRIDTGFEQDSVISPIYDSLLAKVIVHAPNRPLAIAKLKQALENFHVLGIKTNISYLLDVIVNEAFLTGKYDTHFLEREFRSWKEPSEIPDSVWSIYQYLNKKRYSQAQELGRSQNADFSVWDSDDGWSNVHTK